MLAIAVVSGFQEIGIDRGTEFSTVIDWARKSRPSCVTWA
jgi:hypothetical protein